MAFGFYGAMVAIADLRSFVAGMEEVARQQNESYDFIHGLRRYYIDSNFELLHLADQATSVQLGTLYTIETILNDIWINLCTDASFEFPWEDNDMKQACENIREAIRLLAMNAEENGMAITAKLYNALRQYFLCLRRLEDKLQTRGPKSMEVKA